METVREQKLHEVNKLYSIQINKIYLKVRSCSTGEINMFSTAGFSFSKYLFLFISILDPINKICVLSVRKVEK